MKNKYVRNRFIIDSETNSRAYDELRKVINCEHDGANILLYGERGNGRGHLLCATAIELQEDMEKNVKYFAASMFTEAVEDAVERGILPYLQEDLESCDILMMHNFEDIMDAGGSVYKVL